MDISRIQEAQTITGTGGKNYQPAQERDFGSTSSDFQSGQGSNSYSADSKPSNLISKKLFWGPLIVFRARIRCIPIILRTDLVASSCHFVFKRRGDSE